VEWRTFVRAAEVLVPGPSEVPPEDIADNVEKFLIRGRSRRAWRVRALAHVVEWSPLTVGQKPFSAMNLAERRRFIETHWVDGHHIWGICAKIRYLVLVGAYGDGRAHASTSYVPVSRRRRFLQTERNGGRAVAS
jgi:hypothetical protein